MTIRKAGAVIELFAVALFGCSQAVVARFVFVSVDPVVPVEVIARRITRSVCNHDHFIDFMPDHSLAVAKAIADVKGANIMTDVVVSVREGCVSVVGDVGRVK